MTENNNNQTLVNRTRNNIKSDNNRRIFADYYLINIIWWADFKSAHYIQRSLLREIEEGTRKVIFEGENVIEQIKDANKDMDANKFGREQAKLYPGDACKILIDVLRPNGLPEEYQKL